MLALALTLGAGASLALPPAEADPPADVVIVLIDDVGRDKVGVYGDHPTPAPTPHLDQFASRGVLFRNAWAYPTCSPTRAALLTGRHADRTGITTIIRPTDGVYTPLPSSEVLLTDLLPQHTDLCIGKWHLQDSGDAITHPLEFGFDVQFGFRGNPSYSSYELHLNGVSRAESGYLPSSLLRGGLRVMERVQGPRFIYYASRLAHAPFHVPPQYLHGQGNPLLPREQHLAMVEAFDVHFGRLMAEFDLSRTYVFVIGDNGSPIPTILPPWRVDRGKRTPYEAGVRVPFMVAGPGVAAGQECEELVHVTDVFSTVLELLALPMPPGVAQDSVSFAGLLADPASTGGRDTLYVRQAPFPGTVNSGVDEFRALRTRRWKVIERERGQSFELYDLQSDPQELNDLLVSSPGVSATALRDRLLAAMPTFP